MPFDGDVKAFAPQETKYDLTKESSWLREIADFMETLPPEKVWMDGYDCGYAKCAMGWGVTLPALRALPGFPKEAEDLHDRIATRCGHGPAGNLLTFHRAILRGCYRNPPTGPEVAARLRIAADAMDAS